MIELNYKETIISAASTNNSAVLESFLTDSAQNREKAFQEEKINVLKSAFILAARHGHTKFIEIILAHIGPRPEQIDVFLNEVDEHIGKEDTALIEAARNGHVEVASMILRALKNKLPIANSLNRTNAQGETAFIAAARNEHEKVIQLLFEYAKGSLLRKVLMCKDQNQKTGFAYAIEKAQTNPAVQVILNAWSQQLYEGICASNKEIVKAILDSLPVNAKFDCLRCSVFNSDTLLITAAKNNNLIIMKALLKGLTFSQQTYLLDKKNNQGDTAFSIAKKMNYFSMEKWILFYFGNKAARESVSYSFVALAARYLNFSWEYKNILNAWLKGDPQDETASLRTEKMIEVISEPETRIKFNELIRSHLPSMMRWRNSLLSKDEHIAKFFNVLLFNSQYVHEMHMCRNYLENSAQADMFHMFVLIWVAMHDVTEYASDRSIEIQMQEREEALISTCRPFNVLSKIEKFEKNPVLFWSGIINGWMSSLSGLHSNITACIFNVKKLEVSARYMLATEFDCKDYNLDELIALKESLENNNQLTFEVKKVLHSKLEARLHEKFDTLIDTRFIKKEDISAVAHNAVELYALHNKKIHQQIQEKLGVALEEPIPVVSTFRKRHKIG